MAPISLAVLDEVLPFEEDLLYQLSDIVHPNFSSTSRGDYQQGLIALLK